MQMSFAVPFLDFPFYRYQDTPFSTAQQVEMRQDRTASTNKRAPSKIAPRLYLTCLATAKDAKQLAELGITHVVSVIENAPTFPSTHPLRTLHISVSDYDGEDILSHLPATTSFIRGALAESPKNRVMVHCFMGISRSTTVVIAYLIATTKMTPREALATVRSKRPIVCPNRGFMSQLQEYHSKCSNSLQAKLPEEPLSLSLEGGGKRRNAKKARRDGTWIPKGYVRSALAAAAFFPSYLPQQRLGGMHEHWKFEDRIS